MRMSLAIIERAYRGAAEEQYGHVIWYMQMHRKIRDLVDVLLRGNAIFYALREQKAQSLTIGGMDLSCLHFYESSIRDLINDGAEVYVYANDMKIFGVQSDQLVPGVRELDMNGVVTAMNNHMYIYHY